MDNLILKYEITKKEALLCHFIRIVRGTSNCPKFIYKLSKKSMVGKIILQDIL